MPPQQRWHRKIKMKKVSDVYKSIRFAKLDPKHEKAGTTSTDDEEHYTIGEKEWNQQIAHAKKRAMQENTEGKKKIIRKAIDSIREKNKDKINGSKKDQFDPDPEINDTNC